MERILILLLVIAVCAWLLAEFVSSFLAAVVVLIGVVAVLALALGRSRL